jgi:hypothetical protein
MNAKFEPPSQGGNHKNNLQRVFDPSLDGAGDDFHGKRNWTAIIVLSVVILVWLAGFVLLIWSLVA